MKISVISFRQSILRICAALVWLSVCQNVAATEITLAGTFPGRAVLVLNRDAPRTVAVGDMLYGIKLIAVTKDSATVEVDGKKQVLMLGRGNSPARRSTDFEEEANGGQRAVLTPAGGGHFVTTGSINGRGVNFLLDTGASTIAIPQSVAASIGLDMSKARQGAAVTAGGTVRSWSVTLERVRVGDITLYNVEGTVVQADMGGRVLLGNSFLSRVRLTQDGSQSVLVR